MLFYQQLITALNCKLKGYTSTFRRLLYSAIIIFVTIRLSRAVLHQYVKLFENLDKYGTVLPYEIECSSALNKTRTVATY